MKVGSCKGCRSTDYRYQPIQSGDGRTGAAAAVCAGALSGHRTQEQVEPLRLACLRLAPVGPLRLIPAEGRVGIVPAAGPVLVSVFESASDRSSLGSLVISTHNSPHPVQATLRRHSRAPG